MLVNLHPSFVEHGGVDVAAKDIDGGVGSGRKAQPRCG